MFRPRMMGPVFLTLLSAGCAVDVPTDPNTFAVEPAHAAHLRGPQTVTFKNSYQSESKRAYGGGMHTFAVDQKQLTETAITMLTRAVDKHGIRSLPEADKSITLQVRVEQGWVRTHAFSPIPISGARILLDAQFGDGTRTTLPADNTSPMGADRAFDGAVMFALSKLLLDPTFVAYVNTAGADPHKPAALALPAVAVASAPVAALPAARSSRFPQVGDTWTYDLIRRGGPVIPGPRAYVVTVVYSTEAKISDQVTLAGGKPEEWDHGRGPYLVTQIVSILSPYLGLFEDPLAGPMGEITTKGDRSCGGREQCEVTGRITGKEIVRVPAGEFESTKVTVSQVWRNPSGFQGGAFDARRELTGWYAPKAKRFVKFTSRTKMGREPDFDLELTSYQLK